MARAHVILSDDVLKAVDEVVGKRGRSRFIEDAIRAKLDQLALLDALESTAGIASEHDYPHWRDRESAQGWVRETRSSEAQS